MLPLTTGLTAKAYLPLVLAFCILVASTELARWLRHESLVVAQQDLLRDELRTASHAAHTKQVIVSHGFVRISVSVEIPPLATPAPPPPMDVIPVHVRIHRVAAPPPISPAQLSDALLLSALNLTRELWLSAASISLELSLARDALPPQSEARFRAGMAKDSAREAALARFLPPSPGRDAWSVENELHVFLLGQVMDGTEAIGWAKRVYLRAPESREQLAFAMARAVGRMLTLRHPSQASCDKLCAPPTACNLMCDAHSARPSLVTKQVLRARAAAVELDVRASALPSGSRLLGRSTEAVPSSLAMAAAAVFLNQRAGNASRVLRARFVLRCVTSPLPLSTHVLLLELRKSGRIRALALGQLGRAAPAAPDVPLRLLASLVRAPPSHSHVEDVSENKCPMRHVEMRVEPPVAIEQGSRVGISFSAPTARLGLVAAAKAPRAAAAQVVRPFAELLAPAGVHAAELHALDQGVAPLFNVVLM